MTAKNTNDSGLDRMVVAPVRAPNPNNAEHSNSRNQLPDAELGITLSAALDHQRSAQPQTTQIQITRSASLTSYSRSLGPVHKQDDERTFGGVIEIRRHNSGPPHLDYNGSSYSYAHDLEPNTLGKDFFRRPRTHSPDKRRRSILNQVPEEMEAAGVAPQQTRLDHGNTTSGQRNYGSAGYSNVNASTRIGSDDSNSNHLSYDESSESDEEEWLLDEELAKLGLYRGHYKSLLALYTLVPLSSLIAFVSLALIPIFVFPHRVASPFPYPPYLPYPLPEVFTATALWSLAYLLRDFLYAASLFVTSSIPFPTQRFPRFIPIITSVLSAILQSVSSLFLRLLAVPILLIPYYSTERLGLLQPFILDNAIRTAHKHHFPTWQDDAFRRVWWIALGWALAEAIVGIKQGYESIALYKDVLVGVKKNTSKSGLMTETREPGLEQRDRTPSNSEARDHTNIMPKQRDWEAPSSWQSGRHHSSSLSSCDSNLRHYPTDEHHGSAETQPLIVVNSSANLLSRQLTRESDRLMVENEVERDLEELITLKNREELEEIYGIPVIRIPVFISSLHRINSILTSLGIMLLLTAAYMRSTFAYIAPPLRDISHTAPSTYTPSNRSLHIIVPILLAVQTLQTLMHTPWILPRMGIHTFVYIGLLVSLGLFFGGLGVWEALT